MKAKKFIPLLLLAPVLILEALPYGAVLNFGNPEGEPWRRTFSYFSWTPFGYANFGPLITAILTCVLFGLSLLQLRKPTSKGRFACEVLSVLAAAASLMPLLFGLSWYSVTGGAISVLLAAECFALRFLNERERTAKP